MPNKANRLWLKTRKSFHQLFSTADQSSDHPPVSTRTRPIIHLNAPSFEDQQQETNAQASGSIIEPANFISSQNASAGEGTRRRPFSWEAENDYIPFGVSLSDNVDPSSEIVIDTPGQYDWLELDSEPETATPIGVASQSQLRRSNATIDRSSGNTGPSQPPRESAYRLPSLPTQYHDDLRSGTNVQALEIGGSSTKAQLPIQKQGIGASVPPNQNQLAQQARRVTSVRAFAEIVRENINNPTSRLTPKQVASELQGEDQRPRTTNSGTQDSATSPQTPIRSVRSDADLAAWARRRETYYQFTRVAETPAGHPNPVYREHPQGGQHLMYQNTPIGSIPSHGRLQHTQTLHQGQDDGNMLMESVSTQENMYGRSYQQQGATHPTNTNHYRDQHPISAQVSPVGHKNRSADKYPGIIGPSRMGPQWDQGGETATGWNMPQSYTSSSTYSSSTAPMSVGQSFSNRIATRGLVQYARGPERGHGFRPAIPPSPMMPTPIDGRMYQQLSARQQQHPSDGRMHNEPRSHLQLRHISEPNSLYVNAGSQQDPGGQGRRIPSIIITGASPPREGGLPNSPPRDLTPQVLHTGRTAASINASRIHETISSPMISARSTRPAFGKLGALRSVSSLPTITEEGSERLPEIGLRPSLLPYNEAPRADAPLWLPHQPQRSTQTRGAVNNSSVTSVRDHSANRYR